MFLDQILKYVIPEGVTALQRVAVRPAAVFLCAVAVALVLAFGEDTFGILIYWVSRLAGMNQADVPQAAATLSVAGLIALFLLSAGCYRFRHGLLKWWSGCGRFRSGPAIPRRWLFEIVEGFIGSFNDVEKDAARRESEVKKRITDDSSYYTRIRDKTNNLVAGTKPSPPKPLPALPTRSGNSASDWVVYLGNYAWRQLVVGSAQVKRGAHNALFRAIIVPICRSIEAHCDGKLRDLRTEADIRLPGGTVYANIAALEMVTLETGLEDLRRKMDELLSYIKSGDAQAPEPTEFIGKEPVATSIDRLAIECTMVAEIRKIIVDLELSRVALRSGAIGHALARPMLRHDLIKLIEALAYYVRDRAKLPTSIRNRAEEVNFIPRNRLGLVFERSSLGVGALDLEERDGRNYFGTAWEKSPSNLSQPGELDDADLAQCVTLREQAYSGIIGATLALAFCLIVVLLAVVYALPSVQFAFVWAALGFAALFYMRQQLESASIAGATLASVESRLWQEAFPRGDFKEPKPLLWLTAPWRSQLASSKRLSRAAWSTFAIILLLSLASSWLPFPLHRVDQEVFASQPLGRNTKVTERNAAALLKFEPKITPWKSNAGNPPPRPPSMASLIDTVFVNGCGRRNTPGRLVINLPDANPEAAEIREAGRPRGAPAKHGAPIKEIVKAATPISLSFETGAGSEEGRSERKIADIAEKAKAAKKPDPDCRPSFGGGGEGGSEGTDELVVAAPRVVFEGEAKADDPLPVSDVQVAFIDPGTPINPLRVEHVDVEFLDPATPIEPLKVEDIEVEFPDPATPVEPLAVADVNVEFPEPGAPIGTLDVLGPYVMFPEPGKPIGSLDVKGPDVKFPEPGVPIGSLDVKGPYVMFPDPGVPIGPLAVKEPKVAFPEPATPIGPLEVNPPKLAFLGPSEWPGTSPRSDLPEALLLPPVLPTDLGGDGFTFRPGRSLWFKLYCPQITDDERHPCDNPANYNDVVNRMAGVSEAEVIAFVKRQNPKAQYLVLGHADFPDESGQLNRLLAVSRAEIGAQLLHKAGVDNDRITQISMENQLPWIPQDGKEAQALNRRVDIYVSDPKQGD
jgi:hypothetical protein